MTRLEQRTPNTVDCPDAGHQHRWRKRRPELTEGTDRFVVYDVAADGSVALSEEALSQLLRLAGFEPAPPPTAVEQVEAMVAAGSIRLCRQSGPISEAEAQILLDFADELRARGAQR